MRNKRLMWLPNISKPLRNCSPFAGTTSRSLTPKTTASKKKNRRNRNQKKGRRSRSQKAEKPKSRKNSPLLTNQRTPLRNEVELSPKRFLAESSTKGGSAQDLRPKFQPIYQLVTLVALLLPLTKSILSDIFCSGYTRKNIFARRTADGTTQTIQLTGAGRLISAHRAPSVSLRTGGGDTPAWSFLDHEAQLWCPLCCHRNAAPARADRASGNSARRTPPRTHHLHRHRGRTC